jgi:hypothetical protein
MIQYVCDNCGTQCSDFYPEQRIRIGQASETKSFLFVIRTDHYLHLCDTCWKSFMIEISKRLPSEDKFNRYKPNT